MNPSLPSVLALMFAIGFSGAASATEKPSPQEWMKDGAQGTYTGTIRTRGYRLLGRSVELPINLELKQDRGRMQVRVVTTLGSGMRYAALQNPLILEALVPHGGDTTMVLDQMLDLPKAAYRSGRADLERPKGGSTKLTFTRNGRLRIDSSTAVLVTDPGVRSRLGEQFHARFGAKLAAVRSTGTLRAKP